MARYPTAGAIALVVLVALLAVLPSGAWAAAGSAVAPPPPRAIAVGGAAPIHAAGYTVEFQAPFLSSSESFLFELDGTPYFAPAGATLSVYGVSAGLHYITNITAKPVSTSGWKFFGWATPGSPIDVPSDLSVNLSFAYINLSAPLGPKVLQAPRLPSTLSAVVEFNGTTYTVPSTGLTVMIRMGEYDLRPYEVFSPNGSARYFSTSYTANTFLQPGAGPYNITYMVRYLFQLEPSPGGTVSQSFTQDNITYTSTDLQGWYAPSTIVTIRATGTPSNAFGWWTGTGLGSYTGPEPRRPVTMLGPVTEAASFVPIGPNREVIRFNAFGLPNGTIWSVFVDGHGFSSPTSTVVVPGLSPCTTGLVGAHSVNVPVAYANFTDPRLGARYIPVANYSTVMCGNNLTNVYFTTEYLASALSNAGGAVAMDVNGSPVGAGWFGAGTVVQFTATPYAGYRFLGWNGTGVGGYSGTTFAPLITLTGPLSEAAAFVANPLPPPTTYTLTFAPAVALASGTVWTVSLDGFDTASSTSDLVVAGLTAGNHTVVVDPAIAPDGRTRYLPALPNLSVNVTTNQIIPVTFAVEYWLSVGAVGPGTVGTSSAWVPMNATVNLTAHPDPGAALVGWTGVASGSSTLTVSFAMTGPVTVVASFGPAAPAPGIAWSSPGPVGVVAVVALALGLLGGALLRRRDVRRRTRRTVGPRSLPRESP